MPRYSIVAYGHFPPKWCFSPPEMNMGFDHLMFVVQVRTDEFGRLGGGVSGRGSWMFSSGILVGSFEGFPGS